MNVLPSANWNYPTSIKFGCGRRFELVQHCISLGIKRPLIVTDPGFALQSIFGELCARLQSSELPIAVFSAIKSNPNEQNIIDGVRAFHAGQHDGVIAIGGGSALDAGKAIALMSGQRLPLFDFDDVGDNWLRVDVQGIAPVIALPTTAGTGSEVGRVAVITDEQAQIKRLIFHPRVLPPLVILDAELTAGLPASLTAATGMDALSHNLEAWCSPFFHPMAEGIALEGMRRVKLYLPTAVHQGHDLQARGEMLIASTMGATAFQRGLGGMHALAHPLGALYDAHHGMLNAILMPYVLKANETAISARLADAARYLHLASPSFGAVLDWVLSLREELGIPHHLRAIGIDDAQAERVGQMAVVDPSAASNPIAFTETQYGELFRAACSGTL